MDEIPTRPYLLRALYEWCVDNGYTPHIAVKVDARAQVPAEHVRNGDITLNISPAAVHKLQMGNELIEFSARFAGTVRQISVSVASVYALYARETGHGMTFDVDPAKAPVQARGEGEPRLRDAAGPAKNESGPQSGPSRQPALPAPTDRPNPPKPGSGGRPSLRRVK